jgi:hypothetical protein
VAAAVAVARVSVADRVVPAVAVLGVAVPLVERLQLTLAAAVAAAHQAQPVAMVGLVLLLFVTQIATRPLRLPPDHQPSLLLAAIASTNGPALVQ